LVSNVRVAFFRRLLNFPRDTMARLRDKRRARRYPASPTLPVKVSVLLHGADTWTGSKAPQSRAPQPDLSREWAGPMVDLSSGGISFLTLPAAMSSRGEQTKVRVLIGRHVIEIPCTVVYLRTTRDAARLGLSLQFEDEANEKAYLQLLECLVMGATMQPWRPFGLRRNSPGLRREQYRSENGARLYAWREKKGGRLHSFELHLAGHILRGEADALVPQNSLEVFTRSDKARHGPTAVSNTKYVLSSGEHTELRFMYLLVVSNFPSVVPADLRRFLQRFEALEE
jgi:hypothetical protein